MTHPNRAQSPNADEDNGLLRAWGNVTKEGTKKSGQGFTVQKGDKTGVYFITLDEPFTNVPSVVATVISGIDDTRIAMVDDVDTGSFTLRIKNRSNENKDDPFCFLAVGT